MPRLNQNASIIIEDAQMECVRGPQRDQCIFLTMIQNSRNEVRFHATRVMHNEASEENDELGTEVFPASEFSDWWQKRRAAGWRFCG